MNLDVLASYVDEWFSILYFAIGILVALFLGVPAFQEWLNKPSSEFSSRRVAVLKSEASFRLFPSSGSLDYLSKWLESASKDGDGAMFLWSDFLIYPDLKLPGDPNVLGELVNVQHPANVPSDVYFTDRGIYVRSTVSKEILWSDLSNITINSWSIRFGRKIGEGIFVILGRKISPEEFGRMLIAMHVGDGNADGEFIILPTLDEESWASETS